MYYTHFSHFGCLLNPPNKFMFSCVCVYMQYHEVRKVQL